MAGMAQPVILNVYDMASQNSYLYHCGCGVFHSGVEVMGVEYAFGGHEYDYTGIFACEPRGAPGGVLFRESIPVGETDLTQSEIHSLIQHMGHDYKGNKYHLLQRNCNHFANDLGKQLTGKEAPFWINRLAGIAVMLHCLLPSAWVPPLAPPSVSPELIEKAYLADNTRQGLLTAGGQRSDMPGEQLNAAVRV